MRNPNNSQNRLSIIIPIVLLLVTLCLSSAVPFSSSSTQPIVPGVVDLDATHTIRPGPGLVYNVTEIWDGGMYLGYYGGTAHAHTAESMQWTLSVRYNMGGGEPNLLVAIALKRNSSLEMQYPCVTQVILSPGQYYTWIADWYENGVDQVVLADNALESVPDSGHHGTLYTIGVEAWPVNGFDINTANNYQAYGTPWNASRLVGDIRQDGIVNVLDCIKLISAYGATSSSKYWNVNADLFADGTINVLDAVVLSSNFGKHVP